MDYKNDTEINGLVSIIIPVYNREKIVLKAIESVVGQTYKNIEYLIIDDGSTDCTYEVCSKIIEGDDRGRLFHKENGGVSSARNMGIENAKGQYVFFLDSDDILDPKIIEYLVYAIQKYECMIAQGSYRVIAEYKKNEYISMMYDEYLCSQLYEPVVWGKLYIRKIIGETRFDEMLPVREDLDFLYRILKKTKKIVIVNSVLVLPGDQAEHLNVSGKNEYKLLDIKVAERAIKLFGGEESKELRRKIWSDFFNSLIDSYIYCTNDRMEIQKKFRRNIFNFWVFNRTSIRDRSLLLLSWISLSIYKLKGKKDKVKKEIFGEEDKNKI